MKKARFRLDFEVTYFAISNTVEVALFDGSQIAFCKSKGTNHGTLSFEIDQPNESLARREGQRKVEEFFTYLLVAKANFENIKPIGFPRKPALLNREDFKGVPIGGYKELKADAVLVARLDQQELDTTSGLIAKINEFPREKKDVVSRSLGWFRKAAETAGEDRFIFRWISFEALTGLVENGRFSTLLDRYLVTPVARDILDKHKETVQKLAQANLIGWRGAKRSQKLKELLERASSDPKAVLIRAGLCISEVRNNLFHKGEALELVKGSSSLLRDTIRECLKLCVQR